LADLPEWRVAEILNAPDPAFEEILSIEHTNADTTKIMETLGFEAGGTFLTALRDSNLEHLKLIYAAMVPAAHGGLNVGHPELRAVISALTQGETPLLTPEQAGSLLALAERRRHPSWAEVNGVEVTARSVGLARGGVP